MECFSETEAKLKACEDFFQSFPPPEDLKEVQKRAKEFVQRHQSVNRPVVLVTSGGTTVPLEKNTVRFLDNFSAGGRGSKSTEYFLEYNYAVLFLHRAFSLKPFQRHFSTDNVLEWFQARRIEGLKFSGSPAVQDKLRRVVPSYNAVTRSGSLLLISYTTVFQYLYYLKELCILLRPLGPRAMIYLAAAVSDFYIPYSKMSTHKIASSGKMELDFSPTPKMVLPLKLVWAPEAFVITFKLETDEAVLLPHAQQALEKYGHQVVIANLLSSHRTTVTIVTRAQTEKPEGSVSRDEGGSVSHEWGALKLQLSNEDIGKGTEIESYIVNELLARHRQHFHS